MKHTIIYVKCCADPVRFLVHFQCICFKFLFAVFIHLFRATMSSMLTTRILTHPATMYDGEMKLWIIP